MGEGTNVESIDNKDEGQEDIFGDSEIISGQSEQATCEASRKPEVELGQSLCESQEAGTAEQTSPTPSTVAPGPSLELSKPGEISCDVSKSADRPEQVALSPEQSKPPEMKKLVKTDVESSQPSESSSQPLKPAEPSSELPKTAELSAELPKPAELSSELANLFSGELPSVSELQLLLPGVIQDISQGSANHNFSQQAVRATNPTLIPEPKRLDREECRLNLLNHVEELQVLVDARLEEIEDRLDAVDPSTNSSCSTTPSSSSASSSAAASSLSRILLDLRTARKITSTSFMNNILPD